MRQGREARDGGDIPGAQDSPDSFLSCRHVGMSYMSCGHVLCFPPQPGSTVVLGITPSLLARGALEIPNSYSTAAQGAVCQWWGGKGHRSPSSGLYILSRITFCSSADVSSHSGTQPFFFPSQRPVISYPVFVCFVFLLLFKLASEFVSYPFAFRVFSQCFGGKYTLFYLFLMKYSLF